METINQRDWLLRLCFSCVLKHPVNHNEKGGTLLVSNTKTSSIFILGATKLLFSSKEKVFTWDIFMSTIIIKVANIYHAKKALPSKVLFVLIHLVLGIARLFIAADTETQGI